MDNKMRLQQRAFYHHSCIQRLPEQVRVSFLKKNASQKKLKTFTLSQFLEQNSVFYEKCMLCEQVQNPSQMTSLSKCQHFFCTNCLLKYCIYKIDVMQDVNCPQQGCYQLLQPSNKIFKELPQKSKDKFNKYLLWKQTINNPNLKLCPKEDCSGVLDKSKSTYQCTQCNTKYCKECELISHKGPCDDNFQKYFKGWKRCPSCKFFIEKNQGCNHMVCKCSYQFCYVCLSAWSGSHYQCREFTFHQLSGLPRWKRYLLGFLVILLIPIIVVFLIGLWLVGIGIGGICGLFAMPWQLLTRSNFHTICRGLLCPFSVPFGFIFGMVFIFVKGAQSLLQVFHWIKGLLNSLLCTQQEQDNNLVQEEN